MPAAALLARRHLAWHTWLDLPVGLTLPASEAAGVIHLRGPGLADDGPYPPGTVPGWLVLLGISNPGRATVRGTDFAAPLAFSFPGRQVIAARVSVQPAARTARPPAIREADDHSPDRVQVAGDFLLRAGDGCTLTLILSGTPAPRCPLVQHHGALTAGKIISEPTAVPVP